MSALVVLKIVHILAATIFLGTGIGTAFLKARADRSGDLAVIAWAQREIVRADWIFTVPAGLVLPATGWWMLQYQPLSLFATRWIALGLAGWVASGLLWLPAAVLQVRMRNLAAAALAARTDLPPEFHRANRIWLALGVPAFLAAIVSVSAMVGKWALILDG